MFSHTLSRWLYGACTGELEEVKLKSRPDRGRVSSRRPRPPLSLSRGLRDQCWNCGILASYPKAWDVTERPSAIWRLSLTATALEPGSAPSLSYAIHCSASFRQTGHFNLYCSSLYKRRFGASKSCSLLNTHGSVQSACVKLSSSPFPFSRSGTVPEVGLRGSGTMSLG